MPAEKDVLLTGAFGGIGRRILDDLLKAGHEVRCMDLRNPRTETLARRLPSGAGVAWADIRDEAAVRSAVADVDAVVHMAALIPPLANANTALATAVNVDGTRTLIEAMQRSGRATRLVFASSMALAGREQYRRVPPLRVDEPPMPGDHYGRTKAEGEALVKASSLDWSILRIAACPHEEVLGSDRAGLRLMFDSSADARVEFVHFEDVGLAFANAVDCDAAIGKILFIGGGPACQTAALHFYNGMLAAMGLGPLPREAFRPGPPYFFGDWLDTTESQALLRFQRHSLVDFHAWLRARTGLKRHLLRAIAPLANRAISRESPYLGRTNRSDQLDGVP